MKRKVLVMAVTMLALSVSVAYATKPSDVTFYEEIAGSSGLSSKPVGVNMIQESERWGIMTGDITGEWTALYRAVLHKMDPGAKLITVQAEYTIDAAVEGKSGELHIRLDYRLWNMPTEPLVKGNWVITGGTEDLKGLHGQGTFTWYLEGTVQIRQFDGQVHFDP